ncbi:MAG: hypothetical protein HC936_07055 [Leptolyngbyaceae cyanobacterium SU_3_3]|nr:hypothetical protein [Leptolyngbyaceae cyanobacterium SU_3_3]NJR50728.1 hypothetical protein [Leptolyngbyaceae cyanobacterium CSU_1_3]
MIATSCNGISICLPDERWEHVVERHDTLADKQQFVLDTLFNPDRILTPISKSMNTIRERLTEADKATLKVLETIEELKP